MRTHQLTSTATFCASSIKRELVPAPCPSVPPQHSICGNKLGYNYAAISSPLLPNFRSLLLLLPRGSGRDSFHKIYYMLPGGTERNFCFLCLFTSRVGWTKLASDWLEWENRRASKAELSFMLKEGQPVDGYLRETDVMADVHNS